MYEFESFSLEWYKDLFQNTRLLIIVLNTIIIALLSSAISTILGTIGAVGIWHLKKDRRKMFYYR